MRRLLALTLALLLLTSCAPTPPAAPIETTAPPVSVTTAPAPARTAERVAASGELWLEIGYTFHTGERTLDTDIAALMADPANLPYLTLFDDIFYLADVTNVETARQVAGHLFAFIHDTYGPDALFDVASREAYKTAFLTSLGIATPYKNPHEAIGATMDCARDAKGQLVITLEGANYIFAADQYGELPRTLLTMYHNLLFSNVLARRALLPRLRELDPNGDMFDLDRTLNYVMILGRRDDRPTSTDARAIPVDTYTDMLSDTLYALGLPSTMENAWLAAGVADYYGKALGLDAWQTLGDWQNVDLADRGKMDALADRPAYANWIAATKVYKHLGGSTVSQTDFTPALLLHAKAGIERQSGTWTPLLPGGSGGLALSRAQAASLVLYLTEQHGEAALLEACFNYTRFTPIFGDYAAVHAAWGAWLDKTCAIS